uniref:Glabrous enhancer-binding protein-like DBD domain-containing protein n=1 Tax=Leersia perrieri TaxID=77586 RepID=A0A0D9XB69_9ORYZ
MASKRVRSSPSDGHARSASSGGGEPPPQIDNVAVAAQSPTSALAEEEGVAAESEEEAAGDGAEPDNSRRVTALPSKEAPVQEDPKPASKSNKKNMMMMKKKRPLRAAQSQLEVLPPKSKKKKTKAVLQPAARGKAKKKQHDDIAETPSLRKSQRLAAASSGNTSPPHPNKKKKEITALRRRWNAHDEIMILEALVHHIRNGQMLPQQPGHPFFHAIAQRLQGTTTFNHNDVREKLRSLKRRFDNAAIPPTKDHELHLYQLSSQLWAPHAMDKQSKPLATHQQRSFATDDHKSCAMDDHEERSFDDMCSQFPQLAKEINVLAEDLPAVRKSFARLDSKQAVAIETKLEKLRWFDMKMQYKVKVKMAKIRKELLHHLMELRP